MHADPALFHRDIRWPNVLRSTQNRSWFLIDFDDASMAPTFAATHLSRDNHHPGVFQDGHGAEVDTVPFQSIRTSRVTGGPKNKV